MESTDSTPAPKLEELGAADIAAAVELSAEASWNQTAEDWALMMANGLCLGVRDRAGKPVASGIALPMGGRYGWISMVLVTKDWRRRGLATRIVEEGARWLEARGIMPLLDATPDGQKVYERIGFRGLYGLVRWQRPAGANAGTGAGAGADAASGAGAGWARQGTRPAMEDDLDAIAAYDREVFGGERRVVLADLMTRGPACVATDGTGFLLGRRGRNATQIGPVSADAEATAIALLDAALDGLDGPVFVDAYADQTGFSDRLREHGFTEQRRFTRMIRGDAATLGDPARGFAAAGPELG